MPATTFRLKKPKNLFDRGRNSNNCNFDATNGTAEETKIEKGSPHAVQAKTDHTTKQDQGECVCPPAFEVGGQQGRSQPLAATNGAPLPYDLGNLLYI